MLFGGELEQSVVSAATVQWIEHYYSSPATGCSYILAQKPPQTPDSLAVSRRDDTDEVELVSVSEIARDVTGPNRSPERVNVYEIMTKPVVTVSPDMLARYAVRLLVRPTSPAPWWWTATGTRWAS